MSALFAIVVTVAACSVRFSPDYDASIVTGIQKANEEAMVLFASVAPGTSAATFPKRAATYASVIGKLDAMRVAAGARLNPPPPVFLASRVPSGAPTPLALQEASSVISAMRARDQAHGLTANLVFGLRNTFEASIEQALTYERALER